MYLIYVDNDENRYSIKIERIKFHKGLKLYTVMSSESHAFESVAQVHYRGIVNDPRQLHNWLCVGELP